MKKEDEKSQGEEEFNRIVERCDKSYNQGIRFIEKVEAESAFLSRRLDWAEKEIELLKEQRYVIEDIPERVKEAVKKEVSSLSKDLKDQMKALSDQISPLNNIKRRIVLSFAWLGAILFFGILFGLSTNEIGAIIAAIIKAQFAPVPGIP